MKRYLFAGAILGLVVLIISVTVYGFMNMPDTVQEKTVPLGNIDRVDIISAKEVRLQLGALSERLSFDRCDVVIFSPRNIEVSEITLEEGKWSYLLPGKRLALTSLTLLDSSLDSHLDGGDSFSLYYIDDLAKGDWILRIYVDGSSSPGLEEVFVIPDNNTTPKGAFHDPQIISGTEMIVTFGIFNAKVPYYHTSILIASPDDPSGKVWDLEQGAPYLFAYNETLWISIIDMEEQKIINYLDIVRIQSTMGTLTPGTWDISLVYDYTGQEICSVVVEVPPA